jgi:lipoyl(octanoyl) transferase
MPNAVINRRVILRDLGLIDYKQAWDYQEQLFAGVVALKLANRERDAAAQEPTPNYLLFCEHPHVYTLGKSGDPANLLLDEAGLARRQATYYHINRGGDITYHGPGQVVGYPIFDLDNFVGDIHRYLRALEEAIILALRDYGLDGGRIEGLTGVWLDHSGGPRPRKICAIGVRTSRWVTMHGFAFNVNTDLSYFDSIVPCGISDKSVTSLSAEFGHSVGMEEVKERLLARLAGVFGFELETGNGPP